MRSRKLLDRDFAISLLEEVGLESRLNQSARSLSGGEQQRLALARALSTKPDVLLMDEPSASLDPVSAQTIENVICEQSRKGTKVILITHNAAEARRLGDDVIFMHKGKALEHSAAPEFFENPTSSQANQYLNGEIVV